MEGLRKLFIAVILLSMAAVFIAACGGGDESGEDPTATSSSSGSSPTATSSSMMTDPDDEGDGNGSDLSLACSRIGEGLFFTDFTIPESELLGSVSQSPQSDFARDLRDFMESAIETGLGVDAEAACFYEAPGEEGTWITFNISGSFENASSQLQQAVRELGGSVLPDQTSGSTIQGVSVQYIQIGELPFDDSIGGLLFITNGYAIGAAGTAYALDGGLLGPDAGATTVTGPTPSPITATPGSTVAPTEPSGSVTLGGIADAVDGAVRPLLEEELGLGLEAISGGEFTFGGATQITIEYEAEGSVQGQPASGISSIVESFGGTVVSSASFTGTTAVTFTGLRFMDLRANGSITVDHGVSGANATVIVLLQSQS